MNIRQAMREIMHALDPEHKTDWSDSGPGLSRMVQTTLDLIKRNKEDGPEVDKNLKRQRDTLTEQLRIAEANHETQVRIRGKVQEQLSAVSEERDRLRKELGWYPSAYESLTRGLGRIAPELSPMAQLAITQLEAQADSWIDPPEES